jgi:signal transduction histidine kinase
MARPSRLVDRVSPVVVDAAFVVVCAAIGLTTLLDVGGAGTGEAGVLLDATLLGVGVLVVGVAPILVRRRWPLGATAVSGTVYAVTAVTDVADRTAWLLATLVCVYALASLGGERARRVGLPFVAVVAVISATIGLRSYEPEWLAWLRYGAFELLAFAAAWYLGDVVRRRREEEARLADRATRAELEAAEAAARERARIARELHDLVGHAISVISVQATVGEHLAESNPGQAKAALGTIQEVSKQAMVEMRHLVGVLRREDGAPAVAALEPQPGIAELAALVDEERVNGLEVSVDGADEPALTDAAPGLQLAVYRIVQEALTNARKHAPGGAVVVALVPGREALTVTVDNGPSTAAGRAAAVATGTSVDDVGSSGFGLVGMGERVAVYGGTLDTGSRPEGGFSVRAVLPYGDGPTT